MTSEVKWVSFDSFRIASNYEKEWRVRPNINDAFEIIIKQKHGRACSVLLQLTNSIIIFDSSSYDACY